LHLQ
jgi:hypothetical protein